jgi:hypothetical protein
MIYYKRSHGANTGNALKVWISEDNAKLIGQKGHWNYNKETNTIQSDYKSLHLYLMSPKM